MFGFLPAPRGFSQCVGGRRPIKFFLRTCDLFDTQRNQNKQMALPKSWENVRGKSYCRSKKVMIREEV